MSDRVSQTILLCEDQEHERLVKAYLRVCGKRFHPPYFRPIVASRMEHGGNVGWVLSEFPKQLRACRQRQKRAATQLIVLVDADKLSVEDRRRQLLERLEVDGHAELNSNEPAILLVAKYHIETWIRALLGETVSENEPCKRWKKASKKEIQQAAQRLFDWSRPNAEPGPTCIPSLRAALSQWNRIG